MNRFRAGLVLTVVLFGLVSGAGVANAILQASPSQMVLGLMTILLALLVVILFCRPLVQDKKRTVKM